MKMTITHSSFLSFISKNNDKYYRVETPLNDRDIRAIIDVLWLMMTHGLVAEAKSVVAAHFVFHNMGVDEHKEAVNELLMHIRNETDGRVISRDVDGKMSTVKLPYVYIR